MKRPFACVGFSMLFSMVLAIAFHTEVLKIAAVCFVVSAILLAMCIKGNKKAVCAAVCFLSAAGSLFGYVGMLNFHVLPIVNDYSGKTVSFSGMIVSQPYTENGNTRFVIKTAMIDGRKEKLKINITSSYTLPMQIYDCAEGTVELSSAFEEGYGYSSYCAARSIFLTAYINPYYSGEYSVKHNENKPFYSVFNDVRNYFARIFFKYMSYDEASLCTAVVTGDKAYLRDDIYTAFKQLGVSHILVVSGMHLSVIAAMLYLISDNIISNRYISLAIELLGVTAFAGMTGFGFSVRRALIMAVVMILGRFSGYLTDSLNSLGLAAAVLCLDPLNAGDIGMLWSFSCTLSIVVLAEKMKAFAVKKLDLTNHVIIMTISLLSTSTAALIGSIPFFIFVTGSFSPYTLLANILMTPFTGIMIICGELSAAMFALHFNVLGYPLMFITGITAKYYIYVVEHFYKLENSLIRADSPLFVLLMIIIGLILLFVVIGKFKKRKQIIRVTAAASISLLIGMCSLTTFIENGRVVLSVLDVGNGMTLTLKNNNHVVVLNAYGEKNRYYEVSDELNDFNKISCLIDIPPEKTSYNYCRKLTRDFHVDRIIVNNDKLYSQKYCYNRYMGDNVKKITDNYKLAVFSDIMLNIITTDSGAWEYLNIYGRKILICPENSDFNEVPEQLEKCDVYILTNIPRNFTAAVNSCVIISSDDDSIMSLSEELEANQINLKVANGKIDLVFSKSGKMFAEQTCPKGEMKYADNE